MHLARRAWCRTYQTVFRIALPILPYTEPRILEHAEDVPAVLQKRSIRHRARCSSKSVKRHLIRAW